MKYAWLFDIDGTLITTAGAGSKAMYAASEELYGVSPDEGTVTFDGSCDLALVKQILDYAEIELTPENIETFKKNYLSKLPDFLNQESESVLPGVEKILDVLLNRDDVVVGLLTGNMIEGARIKLNHFGLWDSFDFGGFGDNYEDRNDVAKMARRELHKRHPEIDPGHIWVIGDTPRDVICGKAIKSNTMAMTTGSFSLELLEEYDPDIVAQDFNQVYEMLPKLGID